MIEKTVPKVYIILVNYNGIADTKECLKSLQNITYPNYDVIIVDNASKDHDALMQDKEIQNNAILIFSKYNNGFSDGNNQGIAYALNHNADYVLLLNNDTIVEKDFLEALVSTAEKHSDTGIVTGNIFYYSQPDMLWYSNGSFDKKTCITEMVQPTEYEETKITFACGCLMLIRASVLQQIGMLSDKFFLYSEDTDFCCRVAKAGYQLYWTKKSVIYHKVSASTINNSDFQQYYLVRNNLLMIEQYSTNHMKSYFHRFLLCFKDLIKKRVSFHCLLDALSDFHKKQYGRSRKY